MIEAPDHRARRASDAAMRKPGLRRCGKDAPANGTEARLPFRWPPQEIGKTTAFFLPLRPIDMTGASSLYQRAFAVVVPRFSGVICLHRDLASPCGPIPWISHWSGQFRPHPHSCPSLTSARNAPKPPSIAVLIASLRKGRRL